MAEKFLNDRREVVFRESCESKREKTSHPNIQKYSKSSSENSRKTLAYFLEMINDSNTFVVLVLGTLLGEISVSLQKFLD